MNTIAHACPMQKTLQKTLKSRTIFCRDNLEVLRGINSESIDLIYLDPPFNKGQHFHASKGTTAEGAEFKDIWREEDTKEEWHGLVAKEHPALYRYLSGIEQVGDRSNKYYLIYMAARLLELHRILKPTGAVYLHCDPTMSHYLKLLMDTVFGHTNFRNEVIWSYRTGGVSKKWFPHKHDVILSYGKDSDRTFHHPIKERIHYEKPFFTDKVDLTSGKYYADVYVRDVWEDVKPIINVSKQRVGYPTQKPLALLDRIIQASCPAEGIVLDPFCGCATTCIAAERLGRGWIGIDVSKKAYELVRMRMKKEMPGQSPGELAWHDKVIYREDIPQRSDIKGPVQRKEIVKETLFGRQKGYCNGCRESVRGHVVFDYHHLEVDHVVPKSKGGGDNIENLQLLCGHCNKLKGDKDMTHLRAKLKEYQIIP